MSDLSKIISKKDYDKFAGPDWPNIQDIISKKPIANQQIANEVDDFVQKMTQTYNELVLSGQELARKNQTRQQQIFYDKQTDFASPCYVPWETIGINSNGDIYLCQSPSWIPLFVGNILKIQNNIYEALNSQIAREIRQEILQGRYFYCNNNICNFFKKQSNYQKVPTTDKQEPLDFDPKNKQTEITRLPSNLILDFDYTCNFRCPSCRTKMVNNNQHHVIRPINDQISNQIKKYIIDFHNNQNNMTVRWCGGEPFLSDVYVDLMKYILSTGKNISHIIQTNGSYLKSKQEIVKTIMPYCQEFRISFDAATKETYQKVRVGGDWDHLISNVQWLTDFVEKEKVKVQITGNFVVQLDNYKEIPDFLELCNRLNIGFNLQKMWNWGTWPNDIFLQKNIYSDRHPEYKSLQKIFIANNLKI